MNDHASQFVERAKLARREGRLQDCAALYRQAADAFDASGDLMQGAHTARHLAEVLLKTGDASEACTCILAVLLFYRDREVPQLEMANTLRVAALTQEGQGHLDEARALWVEARGLYLVAGVDAGVAEADERMRRLAVD